MPPLSTQQHGNVWSRLQLKTVTDAEMALGHEVFDVSADKCGWDLTSRPPRKKAADGRFVIPLERRIEVKGRQKNQTTITVSRNEILYALNQKEKFILALVLIDGEEVNGPHYVHSPFSREPEDFTASVNLELTNLLNRAVPPGQVPVLLPNVTL